MVRRARRLRLLASTAILLAALLPHNSLANDECGPAPSAVCDAGDAGYPTFANGIIYDPVADLTLVIDGGAAIDSGSHIGIYIASTGPVDVTLEEGASITANRIGILVGSADDVSVRLATGSFIQARDTGIFIDGASGKVVLSLEGKSSIRTNDGANGLFIIGTDKDVSVTLSGDSYIRTNGSSGSGVNISGTSEDLNLNAFGLITTIGDRAHGIRLASNHGDIKVISSGAITTDGKRAYGVYLDYNYEGSIIVDSATAITTSGDYSSAIVVRSPYSADISITHSGAITTSGVSAHGIYIYGADWATNAAGSDVTLVTTAGSSILTSGSSAHGIYVHNMNGGVLRDVTLDLAGTIDAQGTDADGIYMKDTIGAVDIDISGSVSGGTGNGAAIRILGDSPVTLDNSGAIDGAVITGDGDDEFTNAGSLRMSFVDMGAGDDTLINTGTLELDGTSGAIADVESFTNSGIIDLANGSSGDSLSISGTFISAGGFLYLDASLDSGTTDFLTLAAVAPSNNPTFIHVTDVGGSGTALTPIRIIDAGSDASNGRAFGSLPLGAYQYDLTYDASAFDWYLGPLGIFPGTAQYPALVSGALLAFQSDLPSLHTRLQDLRWMDEDEKRIEPAAWTGWSPKLHPWLQLTSTRQEIGNDTPFDLGVTKLEAGLDSRWERGDALYSFGAFAGAGRSLQDFSESTTRADASLLLAGLYGGYRLGGLYGDAIVKYERQLTDYRGIATADEDAPFTVDLLGLSLEAGYRFALPRAYLQPRLRLAYAHAWAGSFEDASGATIDLDSAKSLRGEIGTRLDAPLMGLADVYADASLGHEFLDETQAQVSGLSFTHELPASSARLASGFAVNLLDEKLTLSVEASYSRGEDAEEFAATGGLRLHN